MFLQPKVKFWKRISCALALFAVLLGAAAVYQRLGPVGWLKLTLSETGMKMKINTAIISMICGLIIVLLHLGHRKTTRVLTLFLLFSTCLILIEHIWQVDLGIDNLLAKDTVSYPLNGIPGRTAFLAAVAGLFLASGLLLLSFRRFAIAQLLASITFTLVYASLIGDILTLLGLFPTGLYAGIRSNVAAALLLLSVATLLYEPAQGWMSMIYHKFSNRNMFYYILIYFFCTVPVLVAAFLFILEDVQFSKASGILVLIVVTSVISLPVIYQLLIRLKRLEQGLKSSNEQLTIAIRASGMGVWELNIAFGTFSWSDRQAELLGQTSTEGIVANLFFEQVLGSDQSRIRQAFSQAEKTGSLEEECQVVLPNQQLRWLQLCG